MKRRVERSHEAPEFMREYGAEVFEEKRVYGRRHAKVARRRTRTPRPSTALVKIAA
jgi:hypothetical protein